MTQKSVKEAMNMLYNSEDMEAYEMLWESLKTLWNLGLVDDKIHKAMIEMDKKLFEERVCKA